MEYGCEGIGVNKIHGLINFLLKTLHERQDMPWQKLGCHFLIYLWRLHVENKAIKVQVFKNL